MSNKSKLNDFIQDTFNDLNNCLNGTYWEIERQRQNVVVYYAYSLLAHNASYENKPELAQSLMDKRRAMCSVPKVNDPKYRGSRREGLDLKDAQFEAKKIAASLAKQGNIKNDPTHDKWIQENHLKQLYEISDMEEKVYKEEGISLYRTLTF